MDRTTVYRIDREDRVIYVNEAWLAFAVENDTPELTRGAVLGRPLWEFIEDQETRGIYRELFARIRKGMSAVVVPFRCDSADRIRVMEMELVPLLDGEIQFNCRIIREEAREPIALLDADAERSGGLLKICSWCKKVDLPGRGWVELEDAVVELDLLGEQRPPSLTGGICPACNDLVFGSRKM